MMTSRYRDVQAFRPRRFAPKPLGCGTACLLALAGVVGVVLGSWCVWWAVELVTR